MNWAHAGAFSVGARTLISLLPDSELGIIVLANAHPTGVPEAVASAFFDLVFDGALSRDWLPVFNAVLRPGAGDRGGEGDLRDAAGRPVAGAAASPRMPGPTANGFVGDAVVAEENGGLVVKLGPDGAMSYPLTHFDRDLFIYYPDSGMAGRAGRGDIRDRAGPEGDAGHLRRSERVRPRRVAARGRVTGAVRRRRPTRRRCSASTPTAPAAGSGPPFCRISTEMLSGERTKAMLPSRGGRLMVTPAFMELVAEGVDVVDLIGEVAEVAAAGIDLRVPVIGELDRRILLAGRREEDQRVASLLVLVAPDLLQAEEVAVEAERLRRDR